MSDGFHDPNAGRYRGTDPAAASAFRELQQAMQQMREDPIYKIKSTTAIVGTYNAVKMAGRTSVDGVNPSAAHWGMITAPAAQTILLVNTLESPTNAASAILPGTVLIGSRRLNIDDTDTVFVSYPTSSASGGLDYVDVLTDGGQDGNGPGDGTGGIGDGDSGGGGGGTGGGSGGTCPMSKRVTIGSTTDGANNGTFTLPWNSVTSTWLYEDTFWTVELSYIAGYWAVIANHTYTGFLGMTWDILSVATCPDNGSYGRDPGETADDMTSTCIVSD